MQKDLFCDVSVEWIQKEAASLMNEQPNTDTQGILNDEEQQQVKSSEDKSVRQLKVSAEKSQDSATTVDGEKQSVIDN